LECFQSRPGNLETMTTHEFAELISDIALLLQRLPEVPLEKLSSLAGNTENERGSVDNLGSLASKLEKVDRGSGETLSSWASKLEKVDRGSGERPKPYKMYRGVPIYLYQMDRSDEWSASVEWCGRLAQVELQEWEKPTRETVIEAVHRLINLLEDIKNDGTIWPENYFRSK